MTALKRLLECMTIDEIISCIFEVAYNEKYMQVNDKQIILGYYIELKNLNPNNFEKLHPFYKLPFVSESKAKKIILGSTNDSDSENRLAEVRSILCSVLFSVFNGCNNDKLEKELRINSVDDLKRIIENDRLSKKMYKYIIQYVDLKLRSYTHLTSNPDYYFSNNKYEKIEYEYLDNDSEDKETIQLVYEENDYRTGDMTNYIIDTYFEYLTNKQKLFVQKAIEYGILNQQISDHDNNIIYTKDDIKQYKRNIKKRIEGMIENDRYIQQNASGRWIYNS